MGTALPTSFKLVIALHTTDYRGDHTAEVVRVYDVLPEETVAQLAQRLFVGEYYGNVYQDWIEVRLVVPLPTQ
jgi:hypothetical protein